MGKLAISIGVIGGIHRVVQSSLENKSNFRISKGSEVYFGLWWSWQNLDLKAWVAGDWSLDVV